MTDEPAATPEPFGVRLSALGAATLRALSALEAAQRRLDPPAIPALRASLAPRRDELAAALEALGDCAAAEGIAGPGDALRRGAEPALGALRAFTEPAPPGQEVARILESGRLHCRAQEALYPLRQVFPPLGRFFVEPPWHPRLAALDPERPAGGPGVGLHRAGPGDDPRARGGFSLYVPEWWDGETPLPLVVALHGGFGHGADFLWTWLREARGRGFLLLAPTSRGTTWSLGAPEHDGRALRSMVAWVAARWPVDPASVLLTGLSDGGTFALLTGLHPESPFTALAPVSGVLHPANFALGNVERAAGRRIRIVHGARDWMFPVSLARAARDALAEAGADVVYREVDDLSHAYPREENDGILAWLDPRLALPPERP